jgi:drug/metabolite transporter (DMT)-like permease
MLEFQAYNKFFFRITLALPIIFVLIRRRFKLKKDDLQYFALAGLVFSCFLLSALSSIVFGCPIAVTTALIYTQPFFTAILAAVSGKEKTTSRKIAAMAMGVIGVFLVSGVLTEPLLLLPLPLHKKDEESRLHTSSKLI